MNCNTLKTEVDNWISQYFKNKGTYNKPIYEAMNYSISIGGKRIRPILMLLTYRMYIDDYYSIMPLAAAIEMIHTYSLIHDDLPSMDNDDLRRGKPTNHKVYGEAMAILAGDGLLNEAMNIMFEYCIGKSHKSIEACCIISKAAGADGMIGGQVVDILSEGIKIQKDELLYMHNHKTGDLIKAPIISGAMLGGATEIELNSLITYGEKLGLAFQITDDILDEIGDIEKLGKKTKSDEINCKSNFITTFGLEECKRMSSKLTMECIEILSGIQKDTTALEEITLFLLKREV